MLFQLDECPDLYVDACVCDEQRNLVFLSVWGRDTALQEFLARLTLGSHEGGLEHFHVAYEERLLPVFIPNVDMLQKRTTRSYRGTLFGSMVHLWLYDSRCDKPDLANHSAIALLEKNAAYDQATSLWPLVIETCPLPLLEHWCVSVMETLTAHSMLEPLPNPLGPVVAWRLNLDVKVLEVELGELIRQGHLTASASQPSA